MRNNTQEHDNESIKATQKQKTAQIILALRSFFIKEGWLEGGPGGKHYTFTSKGREHLSQEAIACFKLEKASSIALVEEILSTTILQENLGEALLLFAARLNLFTKSIIDPLFEVRGYKIRYAALSDLEQLENLEEQCWEADLRSSQAQLKERLELYPHGQLVLEFPNYLAGVIYSQRILSLTDINRMNSRTTFQFHEPEGPIVQLIAVNISMQSQSQGLGDELLEFMLQRCSMLPGVTQVAAVTLCKEYHKQKQLSLTEYIDFRDSHGRAIDPILRFHQLHGAQIRGAVPNYRSADIKNEGAGVLVFYDIHERKRHEIAFAAEGRESLTFPDPQSFVQKEIELFLGKANASEFSCQRPLMEMGLDSSHLLALGEKIQLQYQVPIDGAFFFSYNTPEKICLFLQSQLSDHLVDGDSRQHIKDSLVPEAIPSHPSSRQEDIAIIGISCRLPGNIDSLDTLWNFLEQGKSAFGKLPEGRWKWPADIDVSTLPGILRGGFLDDIASFDAPFFRISRKEAEMMDPQQRLALELTWEALENGGYSRERLANSKTGVFIGCSGSDYHQLLTEKQIPIEGYSGLANALAILANRISYFYDFHGPSLQIDTACSSSMVCLYEAVRSLRDGLCQQALVGGIHLMAHPANTIAYYKAGMLSPDGECRPFDHRANGYVRSEGGVMLLLKPLREAIRDRDIIAAVIRGVACNHGGLSGGLTVPNPEFEGELLLAAWEDADLTPSALSYIEAHGTGTPLGDPIEMNGLKKAFATYHADKISSCGVGSIKGNLGHLEAASGMVGVLKIIASFHRGEIPPQANFEKLNPHISLANTPFYIVERLQPWESPDGSLRKAGVSSFGSGGTYAHVILEEHATKPTALPFQFPEHRLFVLSAKNENRLLTYAKKILSFLDSRPEINLDDFAYTLQVGRESMEQRLGVIFTTLEELKKALRQFSLKEEHGANVFFGQANKNKQDIIYDDEDFNAVVDKWIEKKKFPKILTLWVKGYPVDWYKLYGHNQPARISLPTYPFARERYWIEGLKKAPAYAEDEISRKCHPLLHENNSTMRLEKFKSHFSGREFFLKDHVINGHKILPFAAYLEMARAAVNEAIEAPQGVVLLQDFICLRPLVVGDSPQTVTITLVPSEDKDVIDFQIYTKAEEGKAVVHAQGKAAYITALKLDSVNLTHLLAMPTLQSYSKQQCYAILKEIGLRHGPGFQSLDSCQILNYAAIARLILPISATSTIDPYILHPSILEGALQAALILLLKELPSSAGKLLQPFALNSITIFTHCQRQMWASIRLVEGEIAEKIQRLDIDLLDEAGNVAIAIKGISFRFADEEVERAEVHQLYPIWKEKAAKSTPEVKDVTTHLIELSQGNFEEQCVQLFEKIQKVIREQDSQPQLFQVAIRDPLQLGLSGLLKTAHLEHPKIFGQVIYLKDNLHPPLEAILQENRSLLEDREIVYEQNKRFTRSWEELPKDEACPSPWKADGVYLITGGLGGLGLIFAAEIAKEAKGATIILTGRSTCREEHNRQLNTIRSLGATAEYYQADMGNQEEVHTLIKAISEKHGAIHGILHCAGVIHGNYLLKKKSSEFRKVLLPKVSGILHLDEATRDMPLDFFVLFSSIVSIFGNVGLADYAAANSFMDSFASYRHAQVLKGARSGRTVALNWPLWQEGGMQVDTSAQEQTWRATGIMPLDTQKGVEAFQRALAAESAQVMIASGNLKQIKAKLFEKAFVQPQVETTKEQVASTVLIPESTKEIPKILQEISAEFLMEDLDVEAEFSEYGFDSITLTTFSNELNRRYHLDLMPTIFFEHSSIKKLAKYLSDKYPSHFSDLKVAVTPASQPVFAQSDSAKQIQKILQEISAEFLMEDLDVETEFSEYGFDSITLTTFSNELNRRYHLDLMPTIFFEHSSIKKLAKYLSDNYLDSFSSLGCSATPVYRNKTCLVE